MVERWPKANYREMREVRWRRRRCSKSKQDGKRSSYDSPVDRISMLPDDLLSIILSNITFKEQVATSILSHRWRYLWTSTTSLEFDGRDSLLSLVSSPYETISNATLSALKKANLDFVSWVNQVLASRKVSTVEDFKVYFYFFKEYEGCMNEWLRYALACKVQRLELNLNATDISRNNDGYVFPDRFFSHINEEAGSNPNPIHLKQLKTISLNRVGVDGEALEFLLHNCPFLENLSVSESDVLLSLRVTGPFPSLKHLEISECNRLASLEICDVNLVCFKYIGRVKCFHLRNLPMLVHVSVPEEVFEYMKVNAAQFPGILGQLEILTLHLRRSMAAFLLPVEMSNLKQLEVMVPFYLVPYDASLLGLTHLIQSAPRLQKILVEVIVVVVYLLLPLSFSVIYAMMFKVTCVFTRWSRASAKFHKRELQRMKMEKSAYPELEEVELVGLCGCPSDLEIVFHFVDNADALKKILINKKKTYEMLHEHKFFFDHNKIYKDVRRQLEKQIALEKPWIKVEIY